MQSLLREQDIRDEGFEQGLEQGLEQGFALAHKEKIEMAQSLLKSGMSVEEVVKHSKLSLEIVRELLEQVRGFDD